MKLTANFSKTEFDSKDGQSMPVGVLENIKVLAQQLQIVRDEIKMPITINSGYRSPAHNKAVGGKPNSFHVKGMAADIVVNGMRPSEVAAVIADLMILGKIKKGGIGVYSTFCHVDFRGYFVRFK